MATVDTQYRSTTSGTSGASGPSPAGASAPSTTTSAASQTFQNPLTPLSPRQVASQIDAHSGQSDDKFKRDLQNYMAANPAAYAQIQQGLTQTSGGAAASPGQLATQGKSTQLLNQAEQGATAQNQQAAATLTQQVGSDPITPGGDGQHQARILTLAAEQAGIIPKLPNKGLGADTSRDKQVAQSFREAGLSTAGQPQYTGDQVAALRQRLAANGVALAP